MNNRDDITLRAALATIENMPENEMSRKNKIDGLREALRFKEESDFNDWAKTNASRYPSAFIDQIRKCVNIWLPARPWTQTGWARAFGKNVLGLGIYRTTPTKIAVDDAIEALRDKELATQVKIETEQKIRHEFELKIRLELEQKAQAEAQAKAAAENKQARDNKIVEDIDPVPPKPVTREMSVQTEPEFRIGAVIDAVPNEPEKKRIKDNIQPPETPDDRERKLKAEWGKEKEDLIRKYEEIIENQRQTIGRLETSLSSKDEEILKLRAEIEQLKSALKIATEKPGPDVGNEDLIKNLEQRLLQSEQNLKEVQQLYATLQAQHTLLQTQYGTLQGQYQDLRLQHPKELANYQLRIDQGQTALREAQDNVARLQQENQALRQANQQYRAQISADNKINADLKAKLEAAVRHQTSRR